jgi:hypothetical protein
VWPLPFGQYEFVAGDAPIRYRSAVMDNIRWQRFSARSGDIIISTPPKSGTTWMQMICALLIFQRATFDRSLDLSHRASICKPVKSAT